MSEEPVRALLERRRIEGEDERVADPMRGALIGSDVVGE